MNTFRTAMISLVAGIVFGFLIHHPAYPIPTDPDVTKLDALCRQIDEQERVQHEKFGDDHALRLQICKGVQPSTEANGDDVGPPKESPWERLRHFLASLVGPKVASSDQPPSTR
jgi:hypothetical protein